MKQDRNDLSCFIFQTASRSGPVIVKVIELLGGFSCFLSFLLPVMKELHRGQSGADFDL